MKLSVKVRKNCLPEIAGRVGPAAKRGQRDTLDRARTLAQSRSRVDTGEQKGKTQVVGGDTLRAGADHSGFNNYGTRRGVVADYWFSGAVELEMTNVTPIRDELDVVLRCG